MNPLERTDLLDRLALVEKMIGEGRRSTARRGWLFVLWGVGPLIAMQWTARSPGSVWVWPATLAACIVLHWLLVQTRSRGGYARTPSMRSVGAVWICSGVTVLLVGLCAAWSGALEPRALYGVFFALAAVAHGTSSLILRWLPQFLAALVWWLATVSALFLPAGQLPLLAVIALIFGNLVFGAWLVYQERSLTND